MNVDWPSLEAISTQLKRNMLYTIDVARTGHLGACCSSTELMSVLYFTDIMNYDTKDPKHPDRDYVLVRGHLGPLRYNIFQMLGWMDEEEMDGYRQYGTRLCGHEDMNVTPGVDLTPSGSLGMVLSYAVGARLSFQNQDMDNRVFCFLGDGEEQEGNVAEAARHAANLKLDGLITIIDRNKKQLSTATQYTDGDSDVRKIWEGYGWNVLAIEDGHDLKEIYSVMKHALELSGPTCIVAETIKSNGVKGAQEHYSGYHVYHATSEDDVQNHVDIKGAIEELDEKLEGMEVEVPDKRIEERTLITPVERELIINPDRDNKLATSYDYLDEILGKMSDIDRELYILTADYPPRNLIYGIGKFKYDNFNYVNVGIREQHLLSMAHGIRQTDENALIMVLCGDPFLYRFADQMNVLAQSKDRISILAVQAGLSSAKNGFTHQSCGQPGMVLTMPNMHYYEPSSKLDFFHAMNESFSNDGPSYIRTHKTPTPFDFGNFKPESSYIMKDFDDNDLTIVTNGMLVGEVLKASEMLDEDYDISARVVSFIKPSDYRGIAENVVADKPLFVLHNGNPEVLSFPISRAIMATSKRPSTIKERGFKIGKTGGVGELLKHFELDAKGIVDFVRQGR